MSQPTHTEYLHVPWRRALTNNATDADYTTVAPQAAEPASVDSDTPTSNTAVIPVSGMEAQLVFFGTNAENEQFQARAHLWEKVLNGDMWIPYQVGTFDVTLGAQVGVAGATVIDTEFFADTVTETGATWDNTLVSAVTDNAAADQLVIVRIDVRGFRLLQVDFDIDILTTDAASANFLYRFV